MIWLGLVVIAFLILIVGFVYAGVTAKGVPEREEWNTYTPAQPGNKRAAGLIAGVTLLLFLLVGGCGTVASSMHSVPAGHVGVVYRFGAIVGQTGDGVVFTMPWENVKVANVQIQAHRFEGDSAIEAASIETQDVTFTVTLNYSVSPAAIQDLYRNVGEDYFEKLVRSRVNQIFKDETVQYPAIEVTQKRDEIRDAVVARLGQELAPFSITVNALQIDNITYSDQFNQSIEAKQVATQDALREQERVKQREFEAQQAAAVARGEAEALQIRAQGQAEANRLLTESLSPEIIQYEAIQKLADNIQIALIPSGEGIILDPSSILTP